MIIPSIDLMNGNAVQLRQGWEKQIELEEDPLRLAERLAGLPAVQVIDLDAAMGKGDNSGLAREICGVVRARVGGGIRSLAKAREVLGWGAEKIIIGSNANPDFLGRLANEFGRDRLHRRP